MLCAPQNELYPSPAAFELMDDAPRLLEFLGCMLGKAMYEGILLELPLARECRPVPLFVTQHVCVYACVPACMQWKAFLECGCLGRKILNACEHS